MATIIFSPPIIKIILSLAMVITAIGVTVWLIRDDIKKLKKMREQADRADRIWGRDHIKGQGKAGNDPHHPMSGRTNGVISSVKAYDHARTDQQIKDDYASTFENDPELKSYSVPKNKNKKRGSGKGNNHKGGGAR